jgi:hypothetical protein
VAIHCDMLLGYYLLHSLAALCLCPRSWRTRIMRLSVGCERNLAERLQKSHERKGYFVICELLPEADARARVEGEKYERVCSQVLVHPVVNEALGIEDKGYEGK